MTSTIQLINAEGTPSFDTHGTVRGRLEVKVHTEWATVAGWEDSFGGFGSAGGDVCNPPASSCCSTPNLHPRSQVEALVACRQLGNELGYLVVDASKIERWATDDGSSTSQYLVTCAGMESTLASCASFEVWEQPFSNYEVGVACTFLEQGTQCEACVAGKFSDSRLGMCMDCVAGSFSSPGASSCEMCEAGKASATPAAASAAACSPCASGTYSGAVGAAVCMSCDEIFTSLPGSTSPSDCGCPGGQILQADESACKDLLLVDCAHDEFLSSGDSEEERECRKCDNAISVVMVAGSFLTFAAITWCVWAMRAQGNVLGSALSAWQSNERERGIEARVRSERRWGRLLPC